MRLRQSGSRHDFDGGAMPLPRGHGSAEPPGDLPYSDAPPYAGIADRGDEDAAPRVLLPAEARRVILDTLVLHGTPASLAERLIPPSDGWDASSTDEELPVEGEQPSCKVTLDGTDPVGLLAAGLARCLSFAPLAEILDSRVIALIGPPGVGKTTLAAKLAALVAEDKPILINADPRRSGSQAQLAEYAKVLDLDLRPAQEVAQLLRKLRGKRRRLIIDTSGTNPFDAAAVAELAAMVKSSGAEPILVLPASIEASEAASVAAAFCALPIRKLIATRLDMARRLGGLLAAAASGHAIAGASVTPQFAYGLCPLTPVSLARRLLSAALIESRWTPQ